MIDQDTKEGDLGSDREPSETWAGSRRRRQVQGEHC